MPDAAPEPTGAASLDVRADVTPILNIRGLTVSTDTLAAVDPFRVRAYTGNSAGYLQ